jgi:hypothetical protein
MYASSVDALVVIRRLQHRQTAAMNLLMFL